MKKNLLLASVLFLFGCAAKLDPAGTANLTKSPEAMGEFTIENSVYMAVNGGSGSSALAAPVLKLSYAGEYILLGWTSSPRSEKFFLQRNSGNGFEPIALLDNRISTFKDSTVQPSRTYQYRLYAYARGEYSAPSNVISGTTSAPKVAPNAPNELRVVSYTQTIISLEWNDQSNNEESFEVFRGVEGAAATLYRTISGAHNLAAVNLNPSTNYEFKVRARNQYGVSAFTNAVVQKTAAPVNIPAPVVPGPFSINAVPELVQGAESTMISWTASANASSYHVLIGLQSGCAQPSFDRKVRNGETSLVFPGNTSPGNYFLCVAALDANDKEFPASNSPMAITVKPRELRLPGEFTLDTIPALTLGVPMTVRWTAAADATSYRVSIGPDRGCTTLLSSAPTAETSFSLLVSDRVGRFYLCVEAVNADGRTAAVNSPYDIVVVNPAFQIQSMGPIPQNSLVYFNWTASAGVSSYRLRFSQNADCSDKILEYPQLNPGMQSVPFATSSAVGNYFVCMYARNSQGAETPASNNPMPLRVVETGFNLNPIAPIRRGENVMISWSKSSLAVGYHTRFSRVADCSSFIQDIPRLPDYVSSIYFSTGEPAGQYYFCLYGIDAQGVEFRAINSPLAVQIID